MQGQELADAGPSSEAAADGNSGGFNGLPDAGSPLSLRGCDSAELEAFALAGDFQQMLVNEPLPLQRQVHAADHTPLDS